MKIVQFSEGLKGNAKQSIKIRQRKYQNNIFEQAHRAIKRLARSMMCLKNFYCASILLGDIEVMHMIAKWQMRGDRRKLTPAEQFYSLIA
ncbi:hypothetical protein CFB82_41180 [Burkholderia sp. HI2714]|nr:hypothetical protein CFB82_41180 [Burkholderia sp. HI2714]